MKALKLHFLFVFLLSLSLSSIAQDRVGSGAGEAEQNFVFSWLSMEENMRLCLADNFCAEDEMQKDILQDLINSYPVERRQGGIEFQPGHFFNPNEVTKTDSQVGAIIYINEEAIYRNLLNQRQAMTVEEASKFLLIALAQHHHFEVLELAEKFQSFLRIKYIYKTLSYFNLAKIRILQWKNTEANLWLDDSNDIQSLETIFLDKINCSAENLSNFHLQNFYWETNIVSYDLVHTRQSFPLRGSIQYNCQNRNITQQFYFSLVFDVETPQTARTWVGNEVESDFHWNSEESQLYWVN